MRKRGAEPDFHVDAFPARRHALQAWPRAAGKRVRAVCMFSDEALSSQSGVQPQATGEAANANAATATDAGAIDRMLRAHVMEYTGSHDIHDTDLGISTVNGTPFNKLRHTLLLGPGGAVDFVGGRPIVEKGSSIKYKFVSSKGRQSFAVSAVANGKRGISDIKRLDVAPGTEITLKAGAHFVYTKDTWVAK